jgi:hypothetical protein
MLREKGVRYIEEDDGNVIDIAEALEAGRQFIRSFSPRNTQSKLNMRFLTRGTGTGGQIESGPL